MSEAEGRGVSGAEGALASWEVFLRPRRGLAHLHVGSVRAADPDMALERARDLYTRRGDPLSLWVVRSAAVYASSPAERDPFFSGARHKPYRYPEHFAPLTEGGDRHD
ncbi:1,2-phenylacetyl-CoA epoxidase subunit B [Streptomyces actuosus]|uniref:1,2-phenylacetyl-CoA epoxidase subunit B n=1 Tax=Streptomyces actuosus TaxID=1885 RepID=A0ABS2VZF6_STRAS|nr:1,2-phenylacetyl-CoA epoxidase subunit PaaB [Streptomyces actuosus]MBN0048538.1 1,2-phenylacetyl-CoA epoxidase subunit B [Streptomyces actuosus]